MPAFVTVVIPCYNVKNHILGVLLRIGPEVSRIFVIDDACTEGTGQWPCRRGIRWSAFFNQPLTFQFLAGLAIIGIGLSIFSAG